MPLHDLAPKEDKSGHLDKALVTLVNPNKIFPAITPYALDILTTSLEENGFEVEVVDLCFRRSYWREVLEQYFSQRDPLLVGVTIRNTDTIYPQEQRVFLDEHLEIINAIKRSTCAPVVCGGVGFSSMPFALVEYFGIDFGVKGPGELIICQLAEALLRGEPCKTIPGLIIRSENGAEQVPWESEQHARGRIQNANRVTAYRRRSGHPFRVDNSTYYMLGGLGNILTKNGCPFACMHCVEPDAKGNRFAQRSHTAVVDELEELTLSGVHDIHTTDSEVNLGLGVIKKVLKEIIARKSRDLSSPLHNLRLWLYCQPQPFDEEFADLLAEAGCRGVNFGTDHTCDELISRWKLSEAGKPYYTFEHVKAANRMAQERGLLVMHDILLGMPGETTDTLLRCLDDTLALEATAIGYTLGIRIFPYSPLGIQFAAESDGVNVVPGLQSNTAISPILLRPWEKCRSTAEYERQFMFDELGRFRPVYFFSPLLPEDPETLASPNGRWVRTLELMRRHVPQEEHYRVMLPTLPGLSKDDNNYADNPYLLCLAKLGYKGAFWSRWRQREQILREAAERGLVQAEEGLVSV
jgi:tryptophan 2-C-methyltransferase